MYTRKLVKGGIGTWVIAALLLCGAPDVYAVVTSESQNYQMTEMQFGSSTELETCSEEYCAQASIGDTAIGESRSENTAAKFGSNTPSEPLIEVIVDPGVTDLGILETTKTASKTMIVRIKSYLSDGYMLQITGEPPSYDGHTLDTPTMPTSSLPGTEQFAINVAANTTPNVGAAPVQVPSGEMSFGEAEEDYATPNKFMYNSGDVVARSDTESGRTDYTISMIINVSNKTPAGRFVGDFSAVVIPEY